MPPNSKQEIWDHYTQVGDRVVCKRCPKSYSASTAKSSYSSLWYHLRAAHKIDRTVDLESVPQPKRARKQQTLIISYTEKKSQAQMYAELAARDRFSFNQIAKSEFVKDAMMQKKLTSHSSHNTIRSKVCEFYKAAKEQISEELLNMKKSGQRFALTFDEWTGGNKRYLTVNVHGSCKDWVNLGMIRVWGSQTAETLLKLVTVHLEEFGLSMDDIIAMVTDGASIMVKLGRIASCEHVICLSHTLHLVVTDVLYIKKKNTEDDVLSDDEDQDEGTSELENAAEDDEDNPRDDSDASLPNSLSEIETDEPPQLSETIDPVVKKVRTIVNKFRKSPVKNDLLQRIVTAKHGKELSLQRDCKTRSSSMCSMLERFVKISDAVYEVLDDLGLRELKLDAEEMELVKEIINALGPFKTATEFLCKRDSNLAQAEVIVQFIDSKLEAIGSCLSRKLLERLRVRYRKRKNLQLVSLVKFYDNPDSLAASNSAAIEYRISTKPTIIRLSKSIHQRLFKQEVVTSEDDTTATEDRPGTSSSTTDPVPLAKELSTLLQGYSKSSSQLPDTDTFTKEIGLFIAGKQETTTIRQLRNSLMVIPPTSVEAERVFSTSGLFLTKLRCRLNDSSLDMLIFLKFYFSRKASLTF